MIKSYTQILLGKLNKWGYNINMIKLLTIEDVVKYNKNAKKHPDTQLRALANIIKIVGWRQPTLVNHKTGIIVVGHGRWDTWKKFGEEYDLKPIWVIDDIGRNVNGEAETTPMTPEDEIAYRLADNKLNESDWDMDLAIQDLQELSEKGYDTEVTGFSKDLLIDEEDKDDEVPETPVEPKSKLGDIYELGRHRLMCGDSTNKEDVAKLMQNQSADMIFTDPPYNVNYKGGGEKTSTTILNDKMSDENFDRFLDEVFARYSEISKAGAGWYVFHSSTTQDQFKKAIQKSGWIVKTQLIWNKPSGSLGWADYRMKHEPFFYCGKEKTVFYGDRTNISVWDLQDDEEKLIKWAKYVKRMEKDGKLTIWSMKRDNVNEYVHPTQKPVELIVKALVNSSKQDDIVVDLFGGSGSTMIACHKAGRINYSMELDPKFVDVIVSRYCKYTESKTVKRNGEEIEWN